MKIVLIMTLMLSCLNGVNASAMETLSGDYILKTNDCMASKVGSIIRINATANQVSYAEIGSDHGREAVFASVDYFVQDSSRRVFGNAVGWVRDLGYYIDSGNSFVHMRFFADTEQEVQTIRAQSTTQISLTSDGAQISENSYYFCKLARVTPVLGSIFTQ